MSPSQAERRINEILETFELQEKADDLFHTYSTGIKQKLALARGLLNNPQILFIDEPTKSLDPTAAQNIRKLIREKLVKEQGKTVFLATHNLEEAEGICDHLEIIDRGKILCQGAPSQIRKSVSKEDRYILKVRDLTAETLTLSLLIETLVRAGVSILDCSHFEIPLEDVFAQIIKERSSDA
jgi:ABC-2 type transport system ATP-binding protein